jgi:hypothetical protein
METSAASSFRRRMALAGARFLGSYIAVFARETAQRFISTKRRIEIVRYLVRASEVKDGRSSL